MFDSYDLKLFKFNFKLRQRRGAVANSPQYLKFNFMELTRGPFVPNSAFSVSRAIHRTLSLYLWSISYLGIPYRVVDPPGFLASRER